MEYHSLHEHHVVYPAPGEAAEIGFLAFIVLLSSFLCRLFDDLLLYIAQDEFEFCLYAFVSGAQNKLFLSLVTTTMNASFAFDA